MARKQLGPAERKTPPSSSEWWQFGAGNGYVDRVHRPLQCLVFLLPFLLIYQVGSALHPWRPGTHAPRYELVAFDLLLRFFRVFGAPGDYLPLASVVAILLAWHIARRDPWRLEPRLYLGMAMESLAWAIPGLVLGLAIVRHITGFSYLAAAPQAPWTTEIVLSFGAGVYEELLFRLLAITLFNIILVDFFRWRLRNAIPVIILTSAMLFSAYHYLGNESFEWGSFFYRTGLGVYFAGLFIFRGFGIAVGAHTCYDLLVIAMLHFRGQ